MTILSPKAVRAFVNRERRDYSKWKRYTEDKLKALRLALPVRPPIWSRLKLHQKACLLIGIKEKSFAFFLDTGMGKTFLSLALVSYFKRLAEHEKKPQRAMLVLVPNRTNKREWVKQCRKHAPRLLIVGLNGSTAKKWMLFHEYSDADLYVDTYLGFARMVSKMKTDERRGASAKTKGGKKRRRVKWNEALVNKFCKRINGLILDESIFVMNRESLYSRVAHQVRKRTEYAFELNATPFGRDPTALWGQLHLIDFGYTLGETLALFRAVFCTEKDNWFGGTEYSFNKHKKEQLGAWINHKSISYEADEGDLPRVQPVPISVSLPAEASEYAERFAEEVKKSHGNFQAVQNAFLRMRQVSSGFLGFKDDVSGEKASFVFSTNPKLDALIDYIETIPEHYKLIVFHEFNYSGQMICDRLKAQKLPHVWVYGKTKDPDAELEKWAEGKARVLVLSNTAGSYGLNLQIAKYGIFFEAPVSPIIWYQCKRRYERQHSSYKTVFRVTLTTRGTYDESILRFHAEGTDLFEAIIRGTVRRNKRGDLLPP